MTIGGRYLKCADLKGVRNRIASCAAVMGMGQRKTPERFPVPSAKSHLSLETESADQITVAGDVLLLEVVQETTTSTNENQKTTA